MIKSDYSSDSNFDRMPYNRYVLRPKVERINSHSLAGFNLLFVRKCCPPDISSQMELVGLEDSTTPYKSSKFQVSSSIVAQMLSSSRKPCHPTSAAGSRRYGPAIVAQSFRQLKGRKRSGFRHSCASFKNCKSERFQPRIREEKKARRRRQKGDRHRRRSQSPF